MAYDHKFDLPSEIAVLDKFLDNNELDNLMDRLRKAPKTKLVLRGNCLSAEGAHIIAEYLKSEQSELVELVLEWNQLGSAGCLVIADALQYNTSLKLLDLRNNNIKNEGALALADALQSNMSLRSLDLRWNQIDDKGSAAFKPSLLQRKPPLKLQMSGNHLTHAGSVLLHSWVSGEDDEIIATPADNTENISPEEQSSNQGSSSMSPPLGASNSQLNVTSGSGRGVLEAQNLRLQKETATLRQQCKTVQEEATSLNKQLEISAVSVTELEHKVLQEKFRASQAEEKLHSAHARISVQADEHSRLVQQFDEERQKTADTHRSVIAAYDMNCSKLGMERDRAVQEQQAAQDHANQIKGQLESHSAQSIQEKATLQEEISALRVQHSELTLSESRLRSEMTTAEHKLLRSEERLRALEADEKKTKETSDEDHRAAMRARDEAEDTMRSEFHVQLEAANQKIVTQSKEMQILYHKVSQLEGAISNTKADMELQCEKAVAQAREDEAKRTEIVISDLQIKIEMFVKSRAELETRCESYLSDLQSTQESQKSINTNITAQLHKAEEELTRLRDVNTKQWENHNAEIAQINASSAELADLKSKQGTITAQNHEMKSKLAAAVSSERAMHAKLLQLELEVAKHESTRVQEFYSILDSVTSTVKKEFESLQITLNIPAAEASPVATAAAVVGTENATAEVEKEEKDDESESSKSSVEEEGEEEEEEEEEDSVSSKSSVEEEPAYTVEEESSVSSVEA